MVWTTPDLSDITSMLVEQLQSAVTSWSQWKTNGGPVLHYSVNVTGNSPDDMRTDKEYDCLLNLYLLHVGQDPFFRNTPIFGTAAMTNNQQPLSLNLSYLLTAYAKDHADREQQMMGVALSCFHENPIHTPVTGEYLTVSLGPDTLPEMSALWQSFTVAYRLSTIYRVAVVFLQPSASPGTPALTPTTVNITVESPPILPQLIAPPDSAVFTLAAGGVTQFGITIQAAAGGAGAGQTVTVTGVGLGPPFATEIFLGVMTGAVLTTFNITGWLTGPIASTGFTVKLPATYAPNLSAMPPPPAVPPVPPPGAYLLSVGSSSPPFASNVIPLAIAPIFTNITTPPILHPSGGTYTVTGAGFTAGVTDVFVGGILLPEAQVTVDPAGTKITFTLTAVQPPGQLTVRVNGIAAPPTWQVAA